MQTEVSVISYNCEYSKASPTDFEETIYVGFSLLNHDEMR